MSRIVILFTLSLISAGLSANGKLVVNQLGYFPEGDKKAYWLEPTSQQVELISVDNGIIIDAFKVSNSSPLPDKRSLGLIDFSSVRQTGWHQLVAGNTRSVPFLIEHDAYKVLAKRLVKALYLQRSGVSVEAPATGMSRPKSHINDAVILRDDPVHKAGTKLDVTGGWYDAGDFGKYVATTTITVARLMEAYRQAPDFFHPTPEHKQTPPPILSEAVFGLDWLEKMQREDGAVYRKVAGINWPQKIAPWQDKQSRFVYGISTPETAKFAATMAFAYRILKPYYPQKSRRYLSAALHAWDYLAKHPEQYIDWRPDDDSGSGPYIANKEDTEASLNTDLDERLWALAELYLATSQSKYLTQFAALYNKELVAIFEWKNPLLMGIWHLILGTDGEIKQQLMSDLLEVAHRYGEQAHKSPFAVANQRFIWGSNKMTAEAGILMAWADFVRQENAGRAQTRSHIRDIQWHYRSEVQSQIDYLLGANAFDQSFVTHSGTYAVRNLHHLYRIATGVSLPGFLVGGPNEKAQAGIAPKGMGMLSYVDSEKSYAVNEFAIDYNASLIGLLAVHQMYFNQ